MSGRLQRLQFSVLGGLSHPVFVLCHRMEFVFIFFDFIQTLYLHRSLRPPLANTGLPTPLFPVVRHPYQLYPPLLLVLVCPQCNDDHRDRRPPTLLSVQHRKSPWKETRQALYKCRGYDCRVRSALYRLPACVHCAIRAGQPTSAVVPATPFASAGMSLLGFYQTIPNARLLSVVYCASPYHVSCNAWSGMDVEDWKPRTRIQDESDYATVYARASYAHEKVEQWKIFDYDFGADLRWCGSCDFVCDTK